MLQKIFAILSLAGALMFATRCAIITPTPAPTEPPAPAPTLVHPTRSPLPTQESANRVEYDVTYCTMDNIALKLDLYFPQGDAKLAPALVNIHGGSWSGGDKRRSDSAADLPTLVARGYLVAVINYRHAPTYKFPAQIQDVKCAIRFLRANAARYNLDPNRIGAWGCSAGGHLVSLLGVTDKNSGWDHAGEYRDQSSRIQAAAPLCAPADITLYDVIARADMFRRVFGSQTGINPMLVRASPTTHVTKDDPPFLILQGDQDEIIPLAQGEKLREKLTAAGVYAKIVTVQNGMHCFPDEPDMSPTRAEITTIIADFFDLVLQK
ncbi:MAG: alpha/beta hydrolase [Anaerolineales bacterium]|nr:alpha/beta hydrolase [Anaerolineales bacterium]